MSTLQIRFHLSILQTRLLPLRSGLDTTQQVDVRRVRDCHCVVCSIKLTTQRSSDAPRLSLCVARGGELSL